MATVNDNTLNTVNNTESNIIMVNNVKNENVEKCGHLKEFVVDDFQHKVTRKGRAILSQRRSEYEKATQLENLKKGFSCTF